MDSSKDLQFLKNKTILVTGAAGFLAKVFVEKILRIQPNVKKLYLLIRAEDTKSATQRMFHEVVETELFRVLRDTWGENLEPFLTKKMEAIPGDVSYENLGVKDFSLREVMWSEIELVVNVAATTRFDERYDVAFSTNTMGAFNVLSFAKKCMNIKMLLHVSTAYVCGERSGIIPENLFDYMETPIETSNKLDITEEKKLIEHKLKELEAANGSETTITSTMKNVGIKRARLYGWPNTYAFTKAMGEMVLGHYKENIPIIIIRPTVITSTYQEPFSGWIEGLRTIDSPIIGYGKGKFKFLLANPRTVLDLVPVDMVVNSMMIAMMENAKQECCSQIIYQIGSSMRNPVKLSDIVKYSARYFATSPYINKDGKPIKVSKSFLILNSSTAFRTYMTIRYLLPLKGLKLVNSIFPQVLKKVNFTDMNRKIKFVMQLVELYKPLCYSRECLMTQTLRS
ncbi:Fatty acyl-CoA reductase [Melia azedarach]|uniref:Fatty acyl-CoA reductase n=1 Tax=Melia azedarach TaxID=155640 RepID=A0ACC1YEA8_MELAZ|nr:Fatty acyl-CoA reductase [Melia azedarach]